MLFSFHTRSDGDLAHWASDRHLLLGEKADRRTVMLDMEQALQLLRDGERRRWLIADWSWRTEDNDNGGVYIGLVRSEEADKCLESSSWEVSKGDQLVGFTTWREDGVEQVEYGYAPVSSGSWPLVVHRDFHGLAERQFDVIEEFRHFHNLWHDRQSDEYLRIKDDATCERAVFRNDTGALLVDTALLRKFCAARDLCIILQVDAVQLFDEAIDEERTEIREEDLVATVYRTNDAGFANREAFGRLLGKRVIRPLAKEQCGVWPFEDEKKYESYIIGVQDDGQEVAFTCNPEALSNYFGKNPGSPHFLTPVHFRKEVLQKYLAKPSIYTIDDGYLACGGLWGLRMDNDHEDHVVVFLGDLGQVLPESEQKYWRSFNIRPDGGISETLYKRAFQGQFADPKHSELLVKPARERLLESWEQAFAFPLYLHPHDNDKGMLADLRSPISEEWSEFDRCVIAAAKTFVEYLNEADLEKGAREEIRRLRETNPDRPVRGIDKLETWLRCHSASDDLIEHVGHLRLIQRLRSKSAAHRKSEELSKLLREHGMETASPRQVHKALVLDPLLAFCCAMTAFAEAAAASG